MSGYEVVEGRHSARVRLAGAVATIVALLTVLLVANMAPVSGLTDSGRSTGPVYEGESPAVNPVDGGPIFIMPSRN